MARTSVGIRKWHGDYGWSSVLECWRAEGLGSCGQHTQRTCVTCVLLHTIFSVKSYPENVLIAAVAFGVWPCGLSCFLCR